MDARGRRRREAWQQRGRVIAKKDINLPYILQIDCHLFIRSVSRDYQLSQTFRKYRSDFAPGQLDNFGTDHQELPTEE